MAWFIVSYPGAWNASDSYRRLVSVHESKFAAQIGLAHTLAARLQFYKNDTTEQFLNGRPYSAPPYPYMNLSGKHARIVWQTLERVHVPAKVWEELTEAHRELVTEAQGPRLLIKIPFPGFYDSWYSGEIDHVEEQECENMAEESDHDSDGPHQPKQLRLSADELQECFMDAADYGAMHRAIANQYVDEFDSIVSQALGLPLFLEFEGMRSPREYNFETDRLFAHITPATIRALLDYVQAHDPDALGKTVRDRHTSRSGFISFYSNDPEEWPAEILDWDHNQLETLLLAAISASGVFSESRRDDNALDWKIYESMTDGEFFYDVFQDGIDWAKFEAKREELRDEKRDALDPEERAALDASPLPLDPNQGELPL